MCVPMFGWQRGGWNVKADGEALGPLLKPEGTGKSSLDVGRVATDERVTELMIVKKEEGARGGWENVGKELEM